MRRLLIASSFLFVAFLTQHLTHSASAAEFPVAKAPAQVYSNQIGHDLHLLFCEALSEAKHSIFLEMYAITDPTVLSILKNKGTQKTKVEVIADAKASPYLSKKLKGTAHIEFHQGKSLMHRKVVVIDDELVLLGSTNFTKASLTMHDNLVLAFRDHELADFLVRRDSPNTYRDFELAVWKLPEAGKDALEQTCQALRSAQKTISVAMFTFTHARLAEELALAKERGVDVQVALDHYTAEGSSRKVAQFLRSRGVPVLVSQGVQLLHHKWVLIDEDTLIAGSANWTQSAFKRNKEILVKISFLNEEQLLKMQNIWRTIRMTAN